MTYAISAQKRTSMGKRAKDELARLRIPAIVYGHGIEPKSISVGRSEFVKLYKTAGYSSLIDLSVDGEPAVKVLLKDMQVNPLSMDPQHVDFHQIRMDEEITANIPLKFTGESKAMKQDGGTLVKSLDKLEIRCLPMDLPHEIEVDLSKLATFEDAITVGSLPLGKGVELVTAPDLIVATVERPMTEDEIKRMEEGAIGDVTTVKTEAEEKRAEDEAKKAEEAAATGEGTKTEGAKTKPKA